jgi:hypothetical protein
MALKPLTEKPGKKNQEEDSGRRFNDILTLTQKRKPRKRKRRINANEPTIGRLIATDFTDFTNFFV